MASVVDRILEGENVKHVLSASINEETAYDAQWLENVHKAAAETFGADKKLWDLMAFAPDKYYKDELQDALNAFSAWYQKFLKVKKEETV